MQYLIRHYTTFRYRRAIELHAHRLMLFPRSSHVLRVVDSRLSCTPAARLERTQDIFGNLIITAEFSDATSQLVIESEVTVEQSAAKWPVFRIATHAHSYPFAYSEDERTDLAALLAPEHPDPDGELAAWAGRFVHATPTDTLSLLQDLNNGMLDFVGYRTRDEEGTQSPLETLAKSTGSCRDIAALFIDAARLLGFGARAVSGYLYDPDALVDDHGSTHAWAEVYLPGAGWIEFDPTHRRMGSAGLIPVAVARCNAQTMPVEGDYVGAPEDFIGMEVSVSVSKADGPLS
jgi:transglutaminase-like putative cysteine protease